ncbi:MAG: hypothetical protein RLZZ618_1269, partial [Pseudomonadota bacterium]
ESRGTSIYKMVSDAYQVTLVGAVVPLVAGLYWKRATTQGAVFSIGLGIIVWLLFKLPLLSGVFPAQLAGFLAAIVGMVVGTLSPQAIAHRQSPHRFVEGLDAPAAA